MYFCRAQEWRYLALLRVEVCEVYLGGKSGSRSAVDAEGGAGYLIALLCEEVIEEIKKPPAEAGGFV